VFRQCQGGEDPSCADSVPVYDLNVLDHAHYMGQNVLDGVPHGCLYSDELPSSPSLHAEKRRSFPQPN
jgi:hypothetical protein